MSDLYNRIESLCKEKGESITTMCKESGASRASLSDLKMGRNQSLSADTLAKIATHFGVSVDYLLTGIPAYFVPSSCDEENPWEVELLEAFGGLSLGRQIEAVAQVQALSSQSSTKKSPTVSGERDILDDVDVAFYGDYKELSEDDKETLRTMARVMRERRAKAKQE